MKGKLIWSIFWALVGFFVVVAGTIFVGVPLLGRLMNPFFLIICGAPFVLLLGIALLVLTLRAKIGGLLKKFFLLSGASAVGLPVFAVLHNVVYGLFIYFFGEGFWSGIGDEPFFFILATMVCPLGFLVGAIGSIVLFVKKPWLVPKSPSKARTKRKRA